MYPKSARYYDTIYAFKDYAKEAECLHALILEHKRTDGVRLLDVACGTGNHLAYLKDHYNVEGIDVDGDMLTIARRKHPDLPFHQGDMVDFDLGRQFDVVTCLFSSIGYVETVQKLEQAMGNIARHLEKGGLLVLEPWLAPEDYKPNTVHATFVDEPELKIARINTSLVENNVSILDFHHLVGTPDGVEYFVERHTLYLFNDEEYQHALVQAGFEVMYDQEGLSGRGLYLGIKSQS
ncbi:MAG: methyltransferase domain-containing protein [Anaerolineales bacterium]|nr:methyltransferase domain-containing protein [Anaerolineales bacterium]